MWKKKHWERQLNESNKKRVNEMQGKCTKLYLVFKCNFFSSTKFQSVGRSLCFYRKPSNENVNVFFSPSLLWYKSIISGLVIITMKSPENYFLRFSSILLLFFIFFFGSNSCVQKSMFDCVNIVSYALIRCV